MAGILLVVRVHPLVSSGLKCAKETLLQQNGNSFVEGWSLTCCSEVPSSVSPATIMG